MYGVMRAEAAGPQRIRVVVISGVRICLQGLVHLLRAEEGFELTGSAPGVEASVPLLQQGPVDVVLLDMTGDMAGEHGLDALHRLARITPAPLVVLGIPDRAAEVMACAEAGIAGYVTHEDSFADLAGTLRAATRGECGRQAGAAARLVVRLAAFARERRESLVPHLTGRELEVVALIDSGLSNKQIAGRLHIQPTTVKNHVHNVLEKLGVGRRSEAAAAVRRHQLLSPR